MLEKLRKLHWFINVLSLDGKIKFFDKTKNKVNVFYKWNFDDEAGQLQEEKTLLVLLYFCWGIF